MISDAYKVAVHLSIVDKVSPVLAAFSGRLQRAGQDVNALEQKLNRLGKMAAAGGVLAGLGVGILAAAEKFGQAAAQYETIWARLRQMGLGDVQIADARKWAEANDIIGTSLKDRARLFVEAQGAFRESGMSGGAALDAAKTMMPVLANYITARKVLGKDTNEQEELNLNKIVEQMGGLNSSKRAAEIADAVFKASMSSGGMVNARQLRLFKTYAMTASAGLNDRMIFGGLEPIIGEMGGSTAGTGFQTAFNRLNGIMSLAPHLLVQEATKLGIWDSSKVELTRGGAARFNKGDPLNAQMKDLMAHDLPGFAAAMLAKYKTAGITGDADVARENEILFGRTGARFFNLLMKQLPVIQRSLESYDKARGINQTVDDNKNKAPMQFIRFRKAMDDLGTVIGEGVLPVLTPMVERATEMAKALSKHPALLKAITIGFIGLGSALALGGTLMILRAGFGGMGVAFKMFLPVLPAVAKYAVTAGKALMITGNGLSFLKGMAMVVTGPLGLLAQGLKIGLTAAITGLVSPIGIAVLALGTLAAAAYAFRPLSQGEIDSYKDHGGAKLTPDAKRRLDALNNQVSNPYSNEGHGRGVSMPGKQQAIQLNSVLNLDSRKLGEAVTNYIVDGFGRPQSTSSGVDFSRSPPPIGHAYAK